MVAQRPKLSRFGPREERESKRIKAWAEVGSSEKLGAALSLRFIDDVMHRPTGGNSDG